MSVEPSADCCEAVKSYAGRRMLSAAAPRLPLEACSQPAACRCRYRKYEDRRDGSESRRHEGNSMRSVLYAGRERRRSPDRRGDD